MFFAAADALIEKGLNGRAVFNFDVVCEAAAVVIDVQDLHGLVIRLVARLDGRGARRPRWE